MTPCECVQCGYKWKALKETPKHCANSKCQSIFWKTGPPDRLWMLVRDVTDTDQCIEWPHARMSGDFPYGQVQYDGKLWYTHRLSFHLHKGPITDDIFACHTCDNPPCYNPRHIFPGDADINSKDCKAKGRNFIPIGELSPRVILTEEIVKKLRIEYMQTDIKDWKRRCVLYGIDKSTLRHAVTGITWKHL